MSRRLTLVVVAWAWLANGCFANDLPVRGPASDGVADGGIAFAETAAADGEAPMTEGGPTEADGAPDVAAGLDPVDDGQTDMASTQDGDALVAPAPDVLAGPDLLDAASPGTNDANGDGSVPPADATPGVPDGVAGELPFDQTWTTWLAKTAAATAANPAACAKGYDAVVVPPPKPPALPPASAVWPYWSELPACPGSVTATTAGDGTQLEDGSLGCTTCCGPLPHAEGWRCAYGACVVQRCAPGFQDRNGRGEDGCEAAEPVTCNLYVQAANAADPNQDGSAAHPFSAVAPALAKAQAGSTVHVAVGTYAGTLSITTPSILLRGAGSTTVLQAPVPAPNDGPPNLSIAADGVVIEGVRLVGGPAGIRVKASKHVVLRDVEVNSVEPQQVLMPTAICHGANTCVGVDLAETATAVLALVRVAGVKGGPCWGIENLKTICRGVDLTGGHGARVVGLATGSIVGTSHIPCGPGAYCPDGSAGEAGDAAAVLFGGTGKGHSLVAARLTPTKGGVPKQYVDWKFYTATAYDDGRGFGLHFAPDALAQNVGSRVRLGSDPVLYLHGKQGVTVHGYELDAKLRHTNLGSIVAVASQFVTISGCKIVGEEAKAAPLAPPIALLDCQGCRAISNSIWLMGATVSKAALVTTASSQAVVADNQIHHVGGPALDLSGCPGCQPVLVTGNEIGNLLLRSLQPWAWPPADDNAAIVVRKSPGACVVANHVADAKGKPGDVMYPIAPPEETKDGSSSNGIATIDSPGAVVAGNVVEQIQGGKSGSQKPPWAPYLSSGYAGSATGLRLENCPAAVVADNVVRDVHGGNEASLSWYTFPHSGAANGIFLANSKGAVLTRNLVHNVVAGVSTSINPDLGPPWAATACVRVEQSEDVAIGLQTCHVDAPGMREIMSIESKVLVHDSILAGPIGCCGTAWSTGTLAFAYCDLACPGCPEGVAIGPGVFSADPTFAPTGNYALSCAAGACSPAIDAGNPAVAWCGEPAPDGCRINLGHTGGTPQTASQAAASHCGCP